MKRLIAGLAVIASLVLFVPSASAHPLGNFTVNAFSQLEIDGRSVTVIYALDLAEIPTLQLEEDVKPLGGRSLEEAATRHFSAELPKGISLDAGGRGVDLTLEDLSVRFVPGQGGLETLRVDGRFAGVLPSPETEISFEDRNYNERVGWREIVITGAGVAQSSVPAESLSNALRDYPGSLLSTPPRVTRASATLQPGASAKGSESVAESAGQSVDLLGGKLTSLVGGDLSLAFVLFALLVALGTGALHALGPGHGKTVMAAYLVGAGGRARQAVAVGIAVSLMHTFSVVVLGLITLWASANFAPESVYPWLSFLSGVLVLGLGSWLLRARLRGRITFAADPHRHPHDHAMSYQDHDHGHDHHAHEQPHDHSHGSGHAAHIRAHAAGLEHDHGALPANVPLISRRGLGAIAVSGGLLPSPTALIVLLGAVALHRTAFGVALVGAFSVGLAAALTIVGLIVLKARDVVGRRGRGPLSRALPVLSAAVIVLAGLALTTQAVVNLPL